MTDWEAIAEAWRRAQEATEALRKAENAWWRNEGSERAAAATEVLKELAVRRAERLYKEATCDGPYEHVRD